jgi:hypothetical protein
LPLPFTCRRRGIISPPPQVSWSNFGAPMIPVVAYLNFSRTFSLFEDFAGNDTKAPYENLDRV